MARAIFAAGAVLAVVLLGVSIFHSGPLQAPATPSASSDDVVRGQIVIDFAGAPQPHERVTATYAVTAGSTAWSALQQAIGASNIQSVDYGGSLGVFVAGFFAVVAEGNHFWELVLNGRPASTGVSQYIVEDGDVLQFRYSAY